MRLHLSETIGIYIRMLPYLAVRTALYGAVGLAVTLYLGLLAGVVFAARERVTGGSLVALLLLIGGIGTAWVLAGAIRSRWLHPMNAAQDAVATCCVTGTRRARGQSQVAAGRQLIAEHFIDANVVVAVDALVRGSIRAVYRMIDNLRDFIPLPGLSRLSKWNARIGDLTVGFADDAVLSYALSRGERNVWQSAHDGVLLFAQSLEKLLANAVRLTLLGWLLCALLFAGLAVLLWPIYGFRGQGNMFVQMGFFFAPFVLAYALKRALLDPFVTIQLIVAFHKHAASQQPSADWQDRLSVASGRFRQLKERAEVFARDRAAGDASAAEAPGAAPGLQNVPLT
jgi:hypothetical protein